MFQINMIVLQQYLFFLHKKSISYCVYVLVLKLFTYWNEEFEVKYLFLRDSIDSGSDRWKSLQIYKWNFFNV